MFCFVCLAVFLKGHCRTQRGSVRVNWTQCPCSFILVVDQRLKYTSDFVRRKRTLKFRGSLASQEGSDRRRRNEAERRRRGGGAATPSQLRSH